MAIGKSEFRALLNLHRDRIPRKLPRPAPPFAMGRDYAKRLKKITTAAQNALTSKLFPLVESMAAADGVKLDADSEEIGKAIDQVEADFWKRWDRDRMASLVKPTAEEVPRFQAQAENKILRPVVGVDVLGNEPWLDEAAKDFVSRNVALIKTIPQRAFDEVEQLVTSEISQGARWEDLKDKIRERFSVSESRAKLIARDQTNKFYAEISRARHESLGITREIWRTQNDNRVRDEHEALEGTEYDLKRPPLGGPGKPVGCRCYGEPVLESSMEAAPDEAPDKAPVQAEPERVSTPAPVESPEPSKRPEKARTITAVTEFGTFTRQTNANYTHVVIAQGVDPAKFSEFPNDLAFKGYAGGPFAVGWSGSAEGAESLAKSRSKGGWVRGVVVRKISGQ